MTGNPEDPPSRPVPGKPPSHVAIIMDGNGRWASRRNLPRTEGHREGLKVAKRMVKAAEKAGVRYLSLYTFSTENWKRAAEEVGFLMGLVAKYLLSEFDFYRENKVRIVHSGDISGLPPEAARAIRKAVQDTAGFDGITVNLAVNYGGRDEIIRAVKTLLAREECLDEKSIRECMDTPEIPDPDLVIRTGGERRISNFLLWQAAYAELYFSDKLWPDWTEGDLMDALTDYSHRERRFGGTP
ncbi:MAG: polyprenyl diphosphate synthase [Clostridia bacterium]|jgi:undecaprenyl diphosphate synthase|nr:polyprenyl diphosphate synthase [Spirochaetia bacterium]